MRLGFVNLTLQNFSSTGFHLQNRFLQEYSDIKAKLWERVHELATDQREFSGATIPRDMFRDRKLANQFNYSTEFPPTLQVSRLARGPMMFAMPLQINIRTVEQLCFFIH